MKRSFVMLAVVVFLWGSSFTVLKLGLKEISPVMLAFLRFALASLLLVALTWFQERTVFVKSRVRDWKLLPALGLTGVTLYHSFQNVGLQFTTASNSSLIISANPIFIALLDHLYLKTELSFKRVVGIVLAFAGILLVIGPFRITFHPSGLIGDLFSLGAALSWAFYSILGKRMLSQYTAQEVTMFSMVFGTFFLLPFLLLSEGHSLPMSLFSWGLLLLLSVLCSGVAYFLWYKVLEDIPATTAGVSLFFLPVVSVLFAHLVLLEPLDVFFVAGAVFVMLGVFLAAKS
jgi:drug/metabolite transporter (DMT)-like permease